MVCLLAAGHPQASLYSHLSLETKAVAQSDARQGGWWGSPPCFVLATCVWDGPSVLPPLSLPCPVPGASLHGLVWLDPDANGQRAGSEAGRSNVAVQLLQGSTVLATTVTNAAGRYDFVGLTPGAYVVHFVLPPGLVFSPQDQGADDTVDSDANPATGRAGPFTLQAGQDLAGLDAGMCPGVWLADA